MPQYNSVETLAVVRKVFSYIGPGKNNILLERKQIAAVSKKNS